MSFIKYQHYRICSAQFVSSASIKASTLCVYDVLRTTNEGKPIFEQGHGTLAKTKNYAHIVRIFCVPTISPSDRPVRGWIDWLREILVAVSFVGTSHSVCDDVF